MNLSGTGTPDKIQTAKTPDNGDGMILIYIYIYMCVCVCVCVCVCNSLYFNTFFANLVGILCARN
jgi:hypothetical protein